MAALMWLAICYTYATTTDATVDIVALAVGTTGINRINSNQMTIGQRTSWRSFDASRPVSFWI